MSKKTRLISVIISFVLVCAVFCCLTAAVQAGELHDGIDIGIEIPEVEVPEETSFLNWLIAIFQSIINWIISLF